MNFGSCITNKPKETLATIARYTPSRPAQAPTGGAHWPAPTQAGSRRVPRLDPRVGATAARARVARGDGGDGAAQGGADEAGPMRGREGAHGVSQGAARHTPMTDGEERRRGGGAMTLGGGGPR